MRKNFTNKNFLNQLLLLCAVCTISCCTQNLNHQSISAENKYVFKPPVVVTAKDPVVIRLDTCLPPHFISVPLKPGRSHVVQTDAGLPDNVALTPPETFKSNLLLQMQTYNTEQGLAFSGVLSSYCDKKGNLWFGTNGNGISRYDGKSFTNFTVLPALSNAAILSIAEDGHGNLWFGTDGSGVLRYDGKIFTRFNKKQGLAGDWVYSIKEDRSGGIWFGTTGGASHTSGDYLSKKEIVFNNYTFADGLVSNNIVAITEDRKGNLWFATSDSGVSRYDGKSFTSFTNKQGLVNNSVYGALTDRDGNLWFGTVGGGVSCYNGESFRNYTTKEGLIANYALGIFEEKNGDLWFESRGEGVSKLDYVTKKFTGYTNKDGLFSNNIWSILQDKSGSLWFSSFGSGVSRLTKSIKQSASLLLSIFEDKNTNLWLGADGGGMFQLQIDKKIFTRYSTEQGLMNNHVSSIIQDQKGNLWCGTSNGLSKFDLQVKSFTTYTSRQGLLNSEINRVYEDKNGNIWLGTYKGLSKFDSSRNFFTTYTTAQGLAGNYVTGILEDEKRNIWICTDGGISKFDGHTFTNYTTEQGLADKNVVNVVEDKKGNFWFAVYGGGLSRLDNEQKTFITYSSAQGLGDDKATTIAMDTIGNIWLGTANGFTVMKGFNKPANDNSKKDFIPPATGLLNKEIEAGYYEPVFDIYNNNTGYPVKSINGSAMYLTHDGIIWAGTTDKLLRFDPKSIYRNNDTPNVFIQNIKVGNQNICWHDLEKYPEKNDSSITPANVIEETTVFGKALNETKREAIRKKYKDLIFDSIATFYPIPVNLILPYGFNKIEFDFASIEPSRPNLVRYQYILEGYNDSWSIASNESRADFGNINEGTYTFRLKAQSPDGVWSKQLAYTFKVLPPWYRAWWAYVLYLSIFLVSLWSFIKWRERTLKNEKATLENKVTSRTLELKREKEKVENTLSQLKSTQGQLIQSEKMASLGELTAGIAHEIQNPLNFVNNFSEVNKELISELIEEVEKGNTNEVKTLANGIKENEEKINHHGKRADAIVKGMLQHSRQTSGTKEPTDINALCDEYLRLSFHGMRAKDKSFNAIINTDFDKTIGNINIVPQDIGRVLLNLLNNAFYAVSERQKVEGEGLPTGQTGFKGIVAVESKKIDDKVEIRVRDNGSGIPQNIVDKIFQPFFTTKPTGQGTGLGLSLSYDIVKAHGGELAVASNEGKGSTFIIRIPLLTL